jgi:hypothetical protein
MRGRFIEVERARYGHDRFEVRRTLGGGFHLGSSEIADAHHPNVALGPGLRRRPFDEIVHIPAFLAVEEAESAARPAGTATVRDHMDVPARHKEIAGSGFDEAERSAKVLNLTWIGRGRDQNGITARRCRTKNIGKQIDAIAHGDRNIILLGNFELRL